MEELRATSNIARPSIVPGRGAANLGGESDPLQCAGPPRQVRFIDFARPGMGLAARRPHLAVFGIAKVSGLPAGLVKSTLTWAPARRVILRVSVVSRPSSRQTARIS